MNSCQWLVGSTQWTSTVGVAYGSRKTGGLCVFGDQRITGVISKHSTEIVESKEWFSITTGSTVLAIYFINGYAISNCYQHRDLGIL